MNHQIVRFPVSHQTLSLLVSSEAFMFDLHYVDGPSYPLCPACYLKSFLNFLSPILRIPWQSGLVPVHVSPGES